MPDKQIIDITNLDKFKELINDQKKLSIVHFWASWANQCAPMDEALKVLVEEVDSHVATFIRVSKNKYKTIVPLVCSYHAPNIKILIIF